QIGLSGVGEPRTLPWPSFSSAFDAAKNKQYAFDLDKAKALMSQAGVGKVQLTLDYSTTDAALLQIAQIYQADLAKIGVELQLIPNPPGAPTPSSTGKYLILLTLNSWSELDPSTILGTAFYAPYPAPQFKSVRAAY